MRGRTIILIILVLLGAMSVINFSSENATACYTQRTTVNPGGEQTTDDGHISSAQDITEFGGSVTYEIINQYSPGCRSTYDYDFHCGDTAPGWTVALQDAQGNNLNGQSKTFQGSSSFKMYYIVTAVSCENGAVLQSSPWVHTTDNYNEDNIVYIDTTTTLNIPNIFPVIELIAPNGGERWKGTNDVTWTASDTEDNNNDLLVRLRYSTNGRDWTLIEKDIANTGTYSWDTTIVHDGTNYRVQLVVIDSLGGMGYDESDSDFIVDNINPISISVSSPTGDVTWFGTKTIIWSAIDTKLGDDNLEITIQYGTGNNPTWKKIANDEANDGVYDWDTSQAEDGDHYRIRVLASNAWDWEKSDFTDEFKINNDDYLDSDGDGYADCDDAFPNDPGEWLDTDGDKIGNNADPDDDNDGYTDEYELNAGSNPLDPDSMPDYDGDGIDNDNDLDNDNDGFEDALEEELGRDPLDKDDSPGAMLSVMLACPCDMLITDEDDRRLGYAVDGELCDEIPGGVLKSDDGVEETYLLYDPGELTFTVIGTGYGWYDLNFEYINQGHLSIVEATRMEISIRERNRYTIDWEKVSNGDEDGITLEIDADGNSDYELTIETSSPVTMDDLLDTDGDNIIDPIDTDDDGDGYSDRIEIAEDSDPLDKDSIPDDLDGDFEVDSIDDDIDGDGVKNDRDAYPLDVNKWEDDGISSTGPTEKASQEESGGAIGMGKVGSVDTAYLFLTMIVGIIFFTNAGLIFVIKKKNAGKEPKEPKEPKREVGGRVPPPEKIDFERVEFTKFDDDF